MVDQVVFTDNVPDDFDIEYEVLDRSETELVDGESSDAPVADLVAAADAVISSHFTFDEALLDRMTDCRVISRTGIGVDYIDTSAAGERGIVVANVPDYCIGEVADHALGLLLSMQRRIVEYDRAVKEGTWLRIPDPIHRIDGQVLGLVAFGNVARSLARKADALGMDVLAFDPYQDDEFVRRHGAEPASFEDVLRRSDTISLHAPLTSETEDMIGEPELREMKDSACLINTARGGLIDDDALVTALVDGTIRAAGLDVLTEEPPAADDPLLDLPNVVLTPHIAHYSVESREELRRKAARNVQVALSGRIPENAVNEDQLRRPGNG